MFRHFICVFKSSGCKVKAKFENGGHLGCHLKFWTAAGGFLGTFSRPILFYSYIWTYPENINLLPAISR